MRFLRRDRRGRLLGQTTDESQGSTDDENSRSRCSSRYSAARNIEFDSGDSNMSRGSSRKCWTKEKKDYEEVCLNWLV